VARFPSVVVDGMVGEVVEAIITAQTNGVDAFVISEKEKWWLELKLLREKGRKFLWRFSANAHQSILGRKTSLSPTVPHPNTFY
jgi:hypothetical protein